MNNNEESRLLSDVSSLQQQVIELKVTTSNNASNIEKLLAQVNKVEKDLISLQKDIQFLTEEQSKDKGSVNNSIEKIQETQSEYEERIQEIQGEINQIKMKHKELEIIVFEKREKIKAIMTNFISPILVGLIVGWFTYKITKIYFHTGTPSAEIIEKIKNDGN